MCGMNSPPTNMRGAQHRYQNRCNRADCSETQELLLALLPVLSNVKRMLEKSTSSSSGLQPLHQDGLPSYWSLLDTTCSTKSCFFRSRSLLCWLPSYNITRASATRLHFEMGTRRHLYLRRSHLVKQQPGPAKRDGIPIQLDCPANRDKRAECSSGIITELAEFQIFDTAPSACWLQHVFVTAFRRPSTPVCLCC